MSHASKSEKASQHFLLMRPREQSSYMLLVGMQNGTTAMDGSLAISTKTTMYLSFSPGIPLLGIYPEDIRPMTRKLINAG